MHTRQHDRSFLRPTPTASRFANYLVQALQQIGHGSLHPSRALYFLESHRPIGLCGLDREIPKILTMWHMKHSHVADVSIPGAL